MRIKSFLLCFIGLVVTASAQMPKEFLGDWLLVNGLQVLRIDSDGTMTVLNSGVTGPLTLKKENLYFWDTPDRKRTVLILSDRVFIPNDQSTAKWTKFLEFRRGEPDEAREVLALVPKPQDGPQTMEEVKASLHAMAEASAARVERSGKMYAIKNNLRQLSMAADQFYLENGVNKVKFDQLVGPGRYLTKLEPVDGEDYSKLVFTSDTKSWTITSASGITVVYSPGT